MKSYTVNLFGLALGSTDWVSSMIASFVFETANIEDDISSILRQMKAAADSGEYFQFGNTILKPGAFIQLQIRYFENQKTEKLLQESK